jgi:hypothetical protein
LDSGECAKKPLTAEIAEGLAEDAEKSFERKGLISESKGRRRKRFAAGHGGEFGVRREADSSGLRCARRRNDKVS